MSHGNIPVSMQVQELERELEKARRLHKEEAGKRWEHEQTISVLRFELGRRQQLLRRAECKATGVWCWQNDGMDHIESICCPVLIEARDLRELIGGFKSRIKQLECERAE